MLKLRELFKRPGIIRVIGTHNPLGAKLAERAGFDAVWSSGLEISAAHGVPDANILTMSEYLGVAQSMAEAIKIPVIADIDTGYGNCNNVIHAVRKFEGAGIQAVCIEDKLFPKVNSFIPGRQELASIPEFVGKLRAAKDTQRTDDFMVIARTEALIAGWGQEEALKRAYSYAEAGADAILIHSKDTSPQPIIEFINAWDFCKPIVVVPTTYPTITASQLEELGVKMVIYANHGLRASISALEETFAEILRTDSTITIESEIAPLSLVFDLQGMAEFKKAEKAYLHGERSQPQVAVAATDGHLDQHSIKNGIAEIPKNGVRH